MHTDWSKVDYLKGEDTMRALREQKRSLRDWLLDASIFYSFDSSGFLRHQKQCLSLSPPTSEAHVLITGANSGIGFALCELLLSENILVSILCRNHQKGEQTLQALKQKHGKSPKLYLADMSNLEDIDRVCAVIDQDIKAGLPPISCLVHNAGLLPADLQFTTTGHELTVGVHLVGPMRLSAGLIKQFMPGSRIIFMSSGGMYTAPLSPKLLFSYDEKKKAKYDGVYAYALSKRAQVELAQYLHHKLNEAGYSIDVQSIHPGWVDTPGVENALSQFHKFMSGRLRTPQQGALPAAWLCKLPPLKSSHFWFDWKPRSPYLLGKKPQKTDIHKVWNMVCSGAKLSHDWVLHSV